MNVAVLELLHACLFQSIQHESPKVFSFRAIYKNSEECHQFHYINRMNLF